jgi:hypothetical protein
MRDAINDHDAKDMFLTCAKAFILGAILGVIYAGGKMIFHFE